MYKRGGKDGVNEKGREEMREVSEWKIRMKMVWKREGWRVMKKQKEERKGEKEGKLRPLLGKEREGDEGEK